MGTSYLLMLIWILLLPAIFCQIIFDYQSSLIPHPNKRLTGGEDAFTAINKLLVVADGVGGWKQRGIDSGKFSKQLCQNAKNNFIENPQYYSKHPKRLIKVSHQNNNHEGSSTMVVLTLDPVRRVLRSSQIGDSRYIIIRNKQIIYEAKQQLYDFNFPYQLASPHSKHGSKPEEAIDREFKIKNFDILIVGSDGLFDNLFTHDILHIVQKVGQFDRQYLQNKHSVAQYLSHLAIINGKNKYYWSPFSVNAKKYKKYWRGGKLDDTTTIVAQIIYQQGTQDYHNHSSSESRSSDETTFSTQQSQESD